MKNFLFLLLASISISANAQTMYPCGVNGCIARWTFDAPDGTGLATIQDWSGNNNHGSGTNISSVAGWKGGQYLAGKFNGMSSWSDIPHSNSLNTPSEITMISLIKFDDFNSSLCQYNQILSKGYPHFIAGNYGLGVGEGAYDNDCNVFSPNNVQIASQCGNGTFATPAGNYLQLNKWYFLATTISNNNVINYQILMDSTNKAPNMTQINNVNGSYNIGINNQDISLGRHLNPTYPYWVKGEMDEVILFNRVLTPAELYSVYEFLFGYPTATADISKTNNYKIITANKVINIGAKELNYRYEIYNSMGQLLLKKTQCGFSETIDMSNYADQIVYLKISDDTNLSQHTSILIH